MPERLILAAAILAMVCWGGRIYWQQFDQPPPTPVIFGPVISASPTP